MRASTACFLIHRTPELRVLLGYKKIGFGAGKYAGIGGKVEPGETVEAAALREVEEEIGVRIDPLDLTGLGSARFVFPARPSWSQQVFLFTTERWQGTPVERAEMQPAWFAASAIPYAAMWQDARHWLPQVLSGQPVQATFLFANDCETIETIA